MSGRARSAFPQVRQLAKAGTLADHLAGLGIELPVADGGPDAWAATLAEPFVVSGAAGRFTVGNRFCVLPMEGWDGTPDGLPTELTERRWRRFGAGGAKLIWGGEAVAVRHDGRANPRQLRSGDDTTEALAGLRSALVEAHAATHDRIDDLWIGLQLTHSGRWARPDDDAVRAPRIAVRHRVLDARVGLDGTAADAAVLSDDELDALVGDYVDAACRAAEAGFAFVDVKACHGYLVHELLGAYDRPGRYGGDLEGRGRFLCAIVDAIRTASPDLGIGVRLSVFDGPPYHPADGWIGAPQWSGTGAVDEPRRFGWNGADPDAAGLGAVDLAEAVAVVERLAERGVGAICVSAGSPYLNPHVQRPALMPPSDGYLPPEDPLVGAARLLLAGRELAARVPQVAIVASGATYLQEALAGVAAGMVAQGWCSSVGLGRMALSYPDLPDDVLAGRPLERTKLCRTFSDCTTAPRHGLVSGCYPLDGFYKALPERVTLLAAKRAMHGGEEDR